ncbi:hypothetical protein [Phormidium sp. CCY1219]|uniref:hypothetical protein n=1 Tax=Phormidium sp. CCY1219 TaxID=2886104 RepID=UPI002D1EF8B9|nr:hypothetical protein [Phormidium sp. CCY1219]MEB3826446.1 hypothetical protein [Phormidium sp. CCY1219]
MTLPSEPREPHLRHVLKSIEIPELKDKALTLPDCSPVHLKGKDCRAIVIGIQSVMLDKNREQALEFIEKIEAENPDVSAYEIANKLRRYTRRSYNDIRFAIATLSPTKFINRALDMPVSFSDREIDFAHFIAALCDRITLPGLAGSVNFTTAWTAKHTSWTGDLGQAIWDYQQGKFSTVERALQADASPPDLAANIGAFIVGDYLNKGAIYRRYRFTSSPDELTLSAVIREFDSIRYPEQVRAFLCEELGGRIDIDTLLNPAEVEAKIRRGIALFLAFVNLHQLGKQIKNLENYAAELLTKNETCGKEYLTASVYFLQYIIDQGEINAVEFRPWGNPFLPGGFPGGEAGETVRIEKSIGRELTGEG